MPDELLGCKNYIDSVTAHIVCNSVRPKNLKNCMKLIGISRGVGEGSKKKIPSVGEVWIFSGIAQLEKKFPLNYFVLN